MQREWGGCMWWKEEHALILIGGKNENRGDHPHFFIFLWIETKDARFVWIVVAAPRDKSESTLPVQGRWPSSWLFEWVEWTEFPYVGRLDGK
jgi:Ni,Fe-hydrogenase III component G